MHRLTENAMLAVLLPFSATLVASTSSPQKAAMPDPDPRRAADVRPSYETAPDDGLPPTRPPMDRTVSHERAAQGPIPEPVSAANNPLSAQRADSPKEARGRRTLSTAFVRVGPDGHLTVELRNGRVLVLRDVVMRAKDYCGTRVSGGSPKTRYCGVYADVAAARPGGGTASGRDTPANF